MRGNDFRSTARHLGPQREAERRICLNACLRRRFRLQLEQLEIYSSLAMLEVEEGAREEEGIAPQSGSWQPLSGKAKPVFPQARRPRMKIATESEKALQTLKSRAASQMLSREHQQVVTGMCRQ